MAEEKTSITSLQLNGDKPSLMSKLRNVLNSMIPVFRQSIAQKGIDLKVIKLQNVDLDRTHQVVTEIDSRRVFYTCYEDELPPQVIKSINDARDKIRTSVKGVWAEQLTEQLLQDLQEKLADFVTAASRIRPAPKNHHSRTWSQFEALLVQMRLEVWSIVGCLKVIHGDMLQPKHLAPEIFKEAQAKVDEMRAVAKK